VNAILGRYAVTGLEMHGMTRIHEAVFEGQRADAQRPGIDVETVRSSSSSRGATPGARFRCAAEADGRRINPRALCASNLPRQALVAARPPLCLFRNSMMSLSNVTVRRPTGLWGDA
jgi:hypothetical protein